MIICGDALAELRKLPDESVHCCVTSPPYWGLRDYGIGGQLGLEKTPEEYVAKMVGVFREVRRILRKDGTLWLNLGDAYNGGGRGGREKGSSKQATNLGSLTSVPSIHCDGLKPKDLIGLPWRVAFALQADGWYLRSDIIWSKPNPMPESVTDRPTKSHEYVFLMAKSAKYYYDRELIRENIKDTNPGFVNTRSRLKSGEMKNDGSTWEKVTRNYDSIKGANRRSVWTISTKPFSGAHFATFPPDLIEPMILAGCPKSGIVLDPFFGAGTTGLVALRLGRDFIGIELNQKYCDMAQKRIYGDLAEAHVSFI